MAGRGPAQGTQRCVGIVGLLVGVCSVSVCIAAIPCGSGALCIRLNRRGRRLVQLAVVS